MSMFAIGAMDGAMDHFRADPILVIKLTALAFLLALASITVTAIVISWSPGTETSA